MFPDILSLITLDLNGGTKCLRLAGNINIIPFEKKIVMTCI